MLGRGKLTFLTTYPLLYYFSRCPDRYPDDVRALAGRGLTLERMMNKDRAKRDTCAGPVPNGRADVRLRLASLCLDDSEVAEAESQLELLRKTHPDQPDIQEAGARCKYLQGKTEESRRLLDPLLAVRPDDVPQSWILCGQLALSDGKPAEAERYPGENEGLSVQPRGVFRSFR